MTRFIDQIAVFLTLVGLTSLLVGGIGVANGVRAWLDARAPTIATLRCLGASPGLVFAVCLIQVMVLACAGILIGLVLGAALPVLAAGALSDLLPVPPVLGVYPVPLADAAIFGLLIALCFALWPLGRAARIPGGALFRDGLIPEGTRPSWPLVAANAALAVALVALTILASGDHRLAVWFCVAALGTLVLFRAGGWMVMLVARVAPGVGSPAARLGIANLHRPGAPTPLMLLSAGLGLSTLAAVALIQGNMSTQIDEQLPHNAPSFFFIDIQNDQVPTFEKIVAAQPGHPEMHDVPSLRARVVAVKGVPVDQVTTTPDTAWALRGDRGLTYAAMPPEGTRIAAGQWWPPDYNGPPLVSFDAGLARGWDVGIGDIIRVNVLGRDIDLKVASLRDIDWRSLGINFFMVASPGLLSHAPHTHIATVKLPDNGQGALLRAVTDSLPNVTGIRVQDVLGAIAGLLNQVAAALSITGGVTLLAGSFVLVSAVAAGQRRRVREAVILKTLGATRAQIRAAWLTEFGHPGLRRRRDRGAGGFSRELRGHALHSAHGLDIPPCNTHLHAHRSARHHARFRLCWNIGCSTGQTGATLEERVALSSGRSCRSAGPSVRVSCTGVIGGKPGRQQQAGARSRRKRKPWRYSPQYGAYPQTSATTAAVFDAGLRAYMLRVYNWMASGLLMTGIVAYAIAHTSLINAFYPLVETPFGMHTSGERAGDDLDLRTAGLRAGAVDGGEPAVGPGRAGAVLGLLRGDGRQPGEHLPDLHQRIDRAGVLHHRRNLRRDQPVWLHDED